MNSFKDWVQPDPSITDDLRKWGFAPGNYLGKCHTCKKTQLGCDKRSWTCQSCALRLRDEELAKPVPEIRDKYWRELKLADYLDQSGSLPSAVSAALVIRDLIKTLKDADDALVQAVNLATAMPYSKIQGIDGDLKR